MGLFKAVFKTIVQDLKNYPDGMYYDKTLKCFHSVVIIDSPSHSKIYVKQSKSCLLNNSRGPAGV